MAFSHSKMFIRGGRRAVEGDLVMEVDNHGSFSHCYYPRFPPFQGLFNSLSPTKYLNFERISIRPPDKVCHSFTSILTYYAPRLRVKTSSNKNSTGRQELHWPAIRQVVSGQRVGSIYPPAAR